MKSLDELQKICEAATPGPWIVKWPRGNRIISEPLDGDDEADCELIARVSGIDANVTHISAFSPSTALQLIAENRRMLGVLKSLVGYEPFMGTLEPHKVSECLAGLEISK